MIGRVHNINLDNVTHIIRWLLISCCALIPLTGFGCGGSEDGPKRYEVTGSLTVAGKPVPAGMIIFEPDSEKGNSGPGGIADILEGKYKTKPDKGIVGGPHTVRIIGYTEPHLRGQPEPDLLFPEYRVTVDFPTENDITRDFDVQPKH